MKIEVSNGELLDKISILEIKCHKMQNRDKVLNVEKELGYLLNVVKEDDVLSLAFKSDEYLKLRTINNTLWDVEDLIREKEAAEQFDQNFIDLARRVYKLNDIRGALKRQLNEMTNSELIEEKEYSEY